MNIRHLSLDHWSQGTLRCQIECGVGLDDLGYPNALVQTNNSSSRALMQPPSSHERGRDEDASAARVRRGSVHQHSCAQDVRMHAPELPGSSRPRGRTNPFSGRAEQPEKERCFGENSPSAVQMGIESHVLFATMRGDDPRHLSSPSAAGVM